jgi:hypothetical protein
VSAEKFFDAIKVRHEVDGFHAPQFVEHLRAVRFPLIDEMFLAIVGFQEGHDFVSGEISKIGRAQDAAMNGEGENAAGEIAIKNFAFPGGDHVSDTAHALGVPEHFARDAEFV